jgi:hypothetical protein
MLGFHAHKNVVVVNKQPYCSTNGLMGHGLDLTTKKHIGADDDPTKRHKRGAAC